MNGRWRQTCRPAVQTTRFDGHLNDTALNGAWLPAFCHDAAPASVVTAG